VQGLTTTKQYVSSCITKRAARLVGMIRELAHRRRPSSYSLKRRRPLWRHSFAPASRPEFTQSRVAAARTRRGEPTGGRPCDELPKIAAPQRASARPSARQQISPFFLPDRVAPRTWHKAPGTWHFASWHQALGTRHSTPQVRYHEHTPNNPSQRPR